MAIVVYETEGPRRKKQATVTSSGNMDHEAIT